MLNLSTILESTARKDPLRIAITFGGRSFSFEETNAIATRVAAGLATAGVKPGDSIALCCPNLPQFLFIYFGVIKCGATVVPLNVLLKEGEIAFMLEDSGAVGFFCFEDTEELPVGEVGRTAFEQVKNCTRFWSITIDSEASPPFEGAGTFSSLISNAEEEFDTVSRSGEDTAVILYTSGTTGRAKGAELTHNNLAFNATISRDLTTLGPDDSILVVLPLFHVFGQVVLMLAGVLAGARLVILPRFDPGDAWKALEAERITIFAGVPTMYWGLLTHAEANNNNAEAACANLRVCCSGGAAMPLELMKAVEKRFEVVVIEGYGLSETSPVASFNHLDRERKPGSVGQAVWGVEIGIVDSEETFLPAGEVGEIVIRGHCVMKGYLNRPGDTKTAMRGGWFHTGDLGYMDADDYLFIVDRLKDMVLRGGYNVYPREVEEILIEHPEISLVAVIGIPSEEHGEEIKAFIVPKPGANLTESQIIDFAKERIAAYKYPRVVEFRDTLPMNATGKILKIELRKQA